jgi:hypothetical protein
MNICLVTVNFYQYDKINKPPIKNIDSFYITNTEEDIDKLYNIGWKNVFLVKNNKNEINNLNKRYNMIEYLLYPEKYIPEILNYENMLIVDANVKYIDNSIIDNLASFKKNYTLLLNNGYYKKKLNSVEKEFERSFNCKRWKNYHKTFEEYKNKYKNFDLNKIEVLSFKYKLWNIKNKLKNNFITDWIYKELNTMMQGNIVLSICREFFNDKVFGYNFKLNKKNVILELHNKVY